jgi:argininosuccinate lyase
LNATEPEDIFSPLRNRLAFSEYYEQVQALRPEEMKQIVQKLQTVQSKQADVKKQKDDAYEAIKLLSAIESRALHFYTPQP